VGAQTPGPGCLTVTLTACISWRKNDERVLAESLAIAYAQLKAQKRAEKAFLF
jgi:hypothetical protein